MLFILLDEHAQLVRVFMMKTHTHLHNDFRRLNESSRRNQWVALLIKLDAPKGAKTTMTIAQIQLILLVTAHCWLYEFIIGAAASIQHVYPLQYLPQVPGMRTCIADYAAPQGTRNARTKFQSAPAQWCQLVQ